MHIYSVSQIDSGQSYLNYLNYLGILVLVLGYFTVFPR